MKIYLVIILCFFTTQSFASPEIGDYAQYNQIQIKPDKSIVTREVTMSVVGVSDDGETISVEIEGSASSDKVDLPPKTVDMPLGRGDIVGYVTVEIAEELMSTCEEDGGTIETIVVLAGEFETCKVLKTDEQSKTTTWTAIVPSGFVKQEVFWVPTGNLNTFELKAHSEN